MQSRREAVSVAKVEIVLQPGQVGSEQGFRDALFDQKGRVGKFDFIRQGLHDILILYIINIYSLFLKSNYFLALREFFVYISENAETV